ncbi:MAG: hypothetical protein JXB38_14930 [Anaerolineales bacterium]|nr:hypothetical protein [Anaerolineales bacterium]
MTKQFLSNKSRGLDRISGLLRPLALLYLALVLVVGSIAYGYASTTVLDPSTGGDGVQAISGFNVENISHKLSPADPTQITSIQFEVTSSASTSPAGSVYIKVNDDANFTKCEPTTGNTWSCDFTTGSQPSVGAISNLRVIASE